MKNSQLLRTVAWAWIAGALAWFSLALMGFLPWFDSHVGNLAVALAVLLIPGLALRKADQLEGRPERHWR